METGINDYPCVARVSKTISSLLLWLGLHTICSKFGNYVIPQFFSQAPIILSSILSLTRI